MIERHAREQQVFLEGSTTSTYDLGWRQVDNGGKPPSAVLCSQRVPKTTNKQQLNKIGGGFGHGMMHHASRNRTTTLDSNPLVVKRGSSRSEDRVQLPRAGTVEQTTSQLKASELRRSQVVNSEKKYLALERHEERLERTMSGEAETIRATTRSSKKYSRCSSSTNGSSNVFPRPALASYCRNDRDNKLRGRKQASNGGSGGKYKYSGKSGCSVDVEPFCSCSDPTTIHPAILACAIADLYVEQITPTFNEIRRRLEKFTSCCEKFRANFAEEAMTNISRWGCRNDVDQDKGANFIGENYFTSDQELHPFEGDIFVDSFMTRTDDDPFLSSDETDDETNWKSRWSGGGGNVHSLLAENSSFECMSTSSLIQLMHEYRRAQSCNSTDSFSPQELRTNAGHASDESDAISMIGLDLAATLHGQNMSPILQCEAKDKIAIGSVDSHDPKPGGMKPSLPLSWSVFRLNTCGDRRDNSNIWITFALSEFNEFQFFVEPNSPIISYPLSCMAVAAVYLLDLVSTGTTSFRAGRFLMAQAIKRRGPQQLRQMTLGQLCHLVQLLITHNFISYDSHYIRPVFCCESLTKAAWARITTKSPRHKNPHIEKIRRHFIILLSYYPSGIILSQLRNTYEAHFEESLEINFLGYTKLAGFIREELSDTCMMLPTGPFNSFVLSADKSLSRDKPSKATCQPIGRFALGTSEERDKRLSSESFVNDASTRMTLNSFPSSPHIIRHGRCLKTLTGPLNENQLSSYASCEDDDAATASTNVPSEEESLTSSISSMASDYAPSVRLGVRSDAHKRNVSMAEAHQSTTSCVDGERCEGNDGLKPICINSFIVHVLRNYRNSRQMSFNFASLMSPTITNFEATKLLSNATCRKLAVSYPPNLSETSDCGLPQIHIIED